MVKRGGSEHLVKSGAIQVSALQNDCPNLLRIVNVFQRIRIE